MREVAYAFLGASAALLALGLLATATLQFGECCVIR